MQLLAACETETSCKQLKDGIVQRYFDGGGMRLDLRRVNFQGADLSGLHFERTLLSGSHLEKTRLSETHFEKANLMSAHLEGAYLCGTHLEEAILVYAHCEGAIFDGTHLAVAQVMGANFEKARFENVDLENVVGFNGANFERAFGNKTNKLPEGRSVPGWGVEPFDDYIFTHPYERELRRARSRVREAAKTSQRKL